ncbi:hypothetical protein BCD67_24665 [Oscillatoriales cyanobacterium USR001]|nr:hypothetical protein BCD67_24665 [Oscillatoriales cyanobacterium USR001]
MPISHKSSSTSLQPHYWPIAQLPGLSADNESLLQEYGIATTGQLLKKAASSDRKLLLSNQLQVHIQYVNKWVALADMARIPSVGCEYCGLLLHAGVSSTKQLAEISVQRLHQQILRFYVGNMQRRDLCPGVELVQLWIQQAKMLII